MKNYQRHLVVLCLFRTLMFPVLAIETTASLSSTSLSETTSNNNEQQKEIEFDADGKDKKRHLRGLSDFNALDFNALKPQPRIINGRDAAQGRYPYFSLMYGRSMCGGVLIGKRLVLSAAHCVGADTIFRVGASDDVDDGEQINIESTIIHPEYSSSRFDHDVVIFLLENEANLPYIQLEPNEISGGKLTAIGFGDTDIGPGLSLSSTLQEVEVDYIDNDTCDEGHGDNGDVTRDMLCAAGDEKDSCIGDSGGPLILKGDDPSQDRLAGVVSWGRGCALDGYAGVYARISYFYDWIAETSCINFPDEVPAYMNCVSILGLDTEEPTETPTVSPTFEPTDQPISSSTTDKPTSSPTVSPEPTISSSPTTTASPTLPALPMLKFVEWSPNRPLKVCEGDCDTDQDCEGDNTECMKRNGDDTSNAVPGCLPSESVADNVDICIKKSAVAN